MNMGAWLRDLGLETYEPAFRKKDIDFDILRTLKAADLKALGVASRGDRRLLLNAIAARGGDRAHTHRRADALPTGRSTCPVRPSRRQPELQHPTVVGRRPVEAPERAELPPLVGRGKEFSLLLRAWERARAGAGQVVLLSGEPGIGKSRMLRALHERLEGDRSAALLIHHCSPDHLASPLHPVMWRLERAAGFASADRPEEQLAKLRALLAEGTERPGEAASLIADWLDIGSGGRCRPINPSPQRQRQRTLQALLEHLEGLARRRTVLAVYEDLHWADPTTLELIGMMVDRIESLPVLAVMTCRPEFTAPCWIDRTHVAQIPLPRLTPRHGRAMVGHLTNHKLLPEPLVEQIAAKAGGLPLFVEELTKAVLESGSITNGVDPSEPVDALPLLANPCTLHDWLMVRLDRLGPIGEVAQVAAAMGQDLPCALLAAVFDRSEVELQEVLDQLVATGLVFRRDAQPAAVYAFRHALVQNALYQSLPASMRQNLHGRIARTLEHRFPDLAAREPERLARHYTGAGLMEPAATCWLRAARRAAERSASEEAITHLSRALELLDNLAPGPEHTSQKLALVADLARLLAATRGYAAPEVGCAYDLARTLSREATDETEVLPLLYGAWDFYTTRGDQETGRELAGRFQSAAAGAQAPGFRIDAHFCVGVSSFFAGELRQAREHLTRSLVLHDRERHPALVLLSGPGSRAISLSHLAQTLWLCGHPDQAAQASREAITAARAAGDPFRLAYALVCAAWVHQFQRETQATGALAAEAVACSNEERLPLFLAMATVLKGWASTRQQGSDGVMPAEETSQALTCYRATGAESAWPYLQGLLAEVHGVAGDTESGLAALAEGLEVVGTTGELWYEAELRRQQGELLLQRSVVNRRAAGACFCQAIAVAHGQESKSLELRAATSLARLWSDQHRRKEAHDLLARVYDWFTEGFETADLNDAKNLLDELR